MLPLHWNMQAKLPYALQQSLQQSLHGDHGKKVTC